MESDFSAAAEKGPSFRGAPIEGGALQADRLCIVHATRHMPERLEDGTVIINTTSTATGNALPRNTVHLALNHKVSAHGYGNWDDARITVIGDLNAAVARNGAPDALNTVDTYWSRGLGGHVAVPDATIVRPGETGGQIYRISQGETLYKTENYTDADERKLRALLSEDDNYRLTQKLENFAEHMANPKSEKHMFAGFTTKDAIYASYASDVATQATIRHLGYAVQPGGMWSWVSSVSAEGRKVDDSAVTQATNVLAAAMGTTSITHNGTIHRELEMQANGIMNTLEDLNKTGLYPRERKIFTPEVMEAVKAKGYPGGALEQLDSLRKSFRHMDTLLEQADPATREVYQDWQVRVLERQAAAPKPAAGALRI